MTFAFAPDLRALSLILLASVLVLGCDSGGGGTDDPVVAPEGLSAFSFTGDFRGQFEGRAFYASGADAGDSAPSIAFALYRLAPQDTTVVLLGAEGSNEPPRPGTYPISAQSSGGSPAPDEYVSVFYRSTSNGPVYSAVAESGTFTITNNRDGVLQGTFSFSGVGIDFARPTPAFRQLQAAGSFTAVRATGNDLLQLIENIGFEGPGEPLAWSRVAGVPDVDIYAVASDENGLSVGVGDQIYTSSDGGASWSVSALPASENPRPLVTTLLAADGDLIAGTAQNGVFGREGQGGQWTSQSEGLTGLGARSVEALAVRENILYAGTGASVFRRSADGRWAAFRSGIPSQTAYGTVDLVEHQGRLIAAAGSGGFVYLNDEGSTSWTEVLFSSAGGTEVFDVEGAGPALLLAATNGLYRSLDRGNTWSRIELDGRRVRWASLTYDELTGTYFAAALGSEAERPGLYASEDGGTWTQVAAAPGQAGVVVELTAHDGRLFAGTFQGLWSLPIPSSE